jgi:hypothetical protein
VTYRVEFGGGAQVQFHGLPEDARDALVERAATLPRSHGTRSCCLPVAGFEDEVHRRLGRPANRLYPALSNQSEREERAPSSRSQEMTFSCLVLSPLAASSGVPCA